MQTKVLAIAAASTVLGASGFVAQSGPASAWQARGSGCDHPSAWDDDGLGLAFSSVNYESNRAANTGAGAINWNWAVTSDWVATSWNYYMDIGITFQAMGESYPYHAEVDAPCGSGGYYQAPILRWNLSSEIDAGGNTNLIETTYAVHELGHAYGLGHNDTSGCANPPAGNPAGYMFYSPYLKWNHCHNQWGQAPAPDDIKGWGYVHP